MDTLTVHRISLLSPANSHVARIIDHGVDFDPLPVKVQERAQVFASHDGRR